MSLPPFSSTLPPFFISVAVEVTHSSCPFPIQVFFATPHFASGNTNWDRVLSHIIARDFPKGVEVQKSKLFQEIQDNYQVLTDTTQDFATLLQEKRFDIVDFLEYDKLDGLNEVVRLSLIEAVSLG